MQESLEKMVKPLDRTPKSPDGRLVCRYQMVELCDEIAKPPDRIYDSY